MKLQKLLPKEIVEFHKFHSAIAAIVWLTACVFSLLLTWPTKTVYLPASIFFVVTTGGLAIMLLARYENALKVRMNSMDGAEWHVWVNGVKVGTINDAAYARIRYAVFFSVRTHLSQLKNLGHMVSCAIDFFLIAIPIGVFWGGVACYIFAPSTFAEIMNVVMRATPSEAAAALPRIVEPVARLSIMGVLICGLLGRRVGFGFINRFEEGCREHLCQLVGCPFEGQIELFRFVEGARLQLKEWDMVRKQTKIAHQ